ncbi:MAG: hypothetical protein D6765_01665, partial [Bacteroidetes bacterium]
MLAFVLAASGSACVDSNPPLPLEAGMRIDQSVTIQPDTFRLNASDSLEHPLILIEGDDLVVDFNNSLLIGSNDRKWPNEFYGLAILVRNSRNVTIKNARVRGFKVALLAENVQGLRLLDCDFSYNYRQRLKSTRDRENLDDWLSYHDNEQDQWLRYGAAAYLKNCRHALVRGLQVTNGQNGLLMSGCDSSLVYNNSIRFNSGVGIGLYRSSHNRILYNRLDWNVRGYSHGIYARGQDSAGILVYEQSSHNVFAFNSATHSGDGFFLWAGQSTMDSGEGGCNDNLIFGNDFSHAPTNGVEVTFSSNRVIGNRLDDCKYGIWGGYSYQSLFFGNQIKDCAIGIAIEHGQENRILHNLFLRDSIGVQLWERPTQPPDWGYARARDVHSRDYTLSHNRFFDVPFPLDVRHTQNLSVIDSNRFRGFRTLPPHADTLPGFAFEGNLLAESEEELPAWVARGNAFLPPSSPLFNDTTPLPSHRLPPLDSTL